MTKSKSRWIETLQTRVYVGEVHVPEHDGRPARWVPGRHAPVVPAELWARARDRIAGRQRPQGRVKLGEELPLRGHVRVPDGHDHAGHVCTGSGPRGKSGKRVWYYHTLGRGAYRVQAAEAHGALETWLAEHRPTPEVRRLVQALVRERLAEDGAALVERQDRARRALAAVEGKVVRAAEAAVIDVEAHALLSATYRTERDRARAELETARPASPEALDQVERAFDLAGDLPALWHGSDVGARHALMGSIFPSGLRVLDGTLIEPLVAPSFGS